jgi:hypothetical protein
MNYGDVDDGRQTCEHCGRRNFPEVGMSICECGGFGKGAYKVSTESSNAPTNGSYDFAYWSHEVFNPVQLAPKPTKWITYTHLQKETSKAKLFGFYPANGSLNPVLCWVPKSCILNEKSGKIKMKQSFYGQYIKHMIKRKKPTL